MADNIATFIDKLLSVNDFNNPSLTYCVKEHEITKIIQKCTDIVLKQPVMLEIEAPAKVCGDIHGQYWDLLRLFNTCGYPPDHTYLFLGDYVDRGKQGLEVICLLMAYKVHYPEAFFLLRGNHETSSINRIYGFYDECKRRYSVALYNSFQGLFNSLPLCALVGQRIFAMHGGLSPYLSNWDQLTDSIIKRPFDPPHRSLPTDLLWSDPEQGVKGWDKNTRGVSFVFGVDVVKDFCAKMDVDLIVRGHQVVQDGYEFFANKMLVTVFSAPKYCGDFDNNAAVMFINEDLECTFEIILPRNSNPKIRAPLKKKRSKRSKRAESEDDNSTKTSNK